MELVPFNDSSSEKSSEIRGVGFSGAYCVIKIQFKVVKVEAQQSQSNRSSVPKIE